jgi:hypothetical protein
MNSGVMPSRDEGDRFFDEVVSHYDLPAYARRGRRVQGALDDLVEQCRLQRAKWLEMPALRVGQLVALAGNLDRVLPLLADARQLDVVRELQAELRPRLRLPVEPATSERQLRRALRDLCDCLERFNRRWLDHLAKIDLTLVNELREDYNRYYLLEKECALRSPVLARVGFRQLEPLTLDDLQALVPVLPVPQVHPG